MPERHAKVSRLLACAMSRVALPQVAHAAPEPEGGGLKSPSCGCPIS
jgi:hypothetical protein